MSDPALAYPDNVPGPFYCDSTCIDCSMCEQIAPAHFKRNHDEGHDFVYNQPTTAAELELCGEARDACPVNAIGGDRS